MQAAVKILRLPDRTRYLLSPTANRQGLWLDVPAGAKLDRAEIAWAVASHLLSNAQIGQG